MSERFVVDCWNPVQAHKALISVVWPFLKSMLLAGHRMVVEVRKRKRSDAANAMLHAMLGYLSKHMIWAGEKRDIETWKRLIVAAWLRARREQVELLPAVDGHGYDIIFRRTSELSGEEMGELIEYLFAWGSAHDVQFPDPKMIGAGGIDPETGEIYQPEGHHEHA